MIVCGTGHRPDKLGGYSQAVFEGLVDLAEWWLYERRPERVISGMALGWDQALAEASRSLGIPYDAYIPFIGQESKWPAESRQKYESLLRCADSVVECSTPGYAAWKMQIRNQKMVNDADLVLALWDGSEGGTANCIEYARKQGKQIINLWDTYKEMGPTWHP